MEKDSFEHELAMLILTEAKDPVAIGRVRRMSALGHFNRSIFHPERFLKIKFKMFVRFMVNLGMELTEQEFMHLWCELGIRIFEMAENWADEYNESNRRHHGNRQAATH